MKQLIAILVALLVLPVAFGAGASGSIGVDIVTEDFAPLVWMCDHRIVLDDTVQPGTHGNPDGGDPLFEREQNYAFEGEQIKWTVLVMDKNGVEKIKDVFASIGSVQADGIEPNDIEVNCQEISVEMCGGWEYVMSSCNARILEEQFGYCDFDDDVMQYYECTLTVETPESMYGEYWITVEAVDMDEYIGTMDENEYWFLNPEIYLSITGDLTFTNVRPGTDSYSDTLLVGNDADDSSGVRLEMFISGTNFYDGSSSGAMCPTSNVLDLSNFRYFATNGYWDTYGIPGTDDEGYSYIPYGDEITESKEIIGSGLYPDLGYEGPYFPGNTGNVLTPGSEMALTFKLSLPEPCNGDFDDGSIFFWGEAI